MKKNILLVLLCAALTFGTLNGVYAQEVKTDNNSVIYAQIQSITKMINNLIAQIERLRQSRQVNNGNFASTTSPIVEESDEAKASTGLRKVKTLRMEVELALAKSDSEEKSRIARNALDVSFKYLPTAERDYQAKRYVSSYKMTAELIRSLEEALSNFAPKCSLDAYICPDGSATYRSGPKCQFAACPVKIDPIIPIACTMDAKICPDGSSVGRTGPKCEFPACPVSDISACELVLCADGQKCDNTCLPTTPTPFEEVI